MQVAFEFESRHGCVVVRDSESDGDVSNAPRDSLWYFDRSSAILAVQPAVEGPVRCEVWIGTLLDPLPLRVASLLPSRKCGAVAGSSFSSTM